MEDVKKDQIASGAVRKREPVGVLGAIQPRIRKKVGRHALRNKLFNRPDPGPELNNQTRLIDQLLQNQAVKTSVSLAQRRLTFPYLAIAQNLDQMLINRRGCRRTHIIAMLRTCLDRINHCTIWKKSVKVWGASFLPPTLDRWVTLQAHRLGLMGAEEKQFLQKCVRPDWRIADVGANQGLYTLLLSSLVQYGQVYAFEPDPSLFLSLQENMRRNGTKNITLFNAAAANQVAKLVLQPGRLNRGDNRIISHSPTARHTIEVNAIPLDQAITETRLDLLKIDVQGFEMEVLRGAKRLIEQNSTLIILTEFWPHGLRLANSDPTDLIDLLTASGFSLFRIVKPGLLERFAYKAAAWRRPDQFCNLVAIRSSDLRESAPSGLTIAAYRNKEVLTLEK
jgi:FkbM family methyltransferase